MTLVIILATVFLGLAIVLFLGTMLVHCKAACSAPSRVAEIRRLRHEGLAAHREEA
jgi:hypothetical protein